MCDAMSSSPSLPRGPAAGDAVPITVSRPQVSIERLPTRRQSNAPRESMNCKSCRKRKVDAVPKKRGPKTDVLEALLKRVDGLEAKLAGKHGHQDLAKTEVSGKGRRDKERSTDDAEPASKRITTETSGRLPCEDEARKATDSLKNLQASPADTDAFLHTYFTRLHGRPYYILDESTTRQRIRLKQLPDYLTDAIWAVASRHTPHPDGSKGAAKLSEDYASRARQSLDTDEPRIESLQALVLLVIAFTASCHAKKAYMLMASATGMVMALELHREINAEAKVTPVDREVRRRLFWTCYLLDRYLSCGSKRSSLISDACIALRLPSWSLSPSSLPIDGEPFQKGSNLQSRQGSTNRCQGSMGMIVDITRLLGWANQYMAAGGVKGDSHFPWHSSSTLSQIQQELDVWVSGAKPVADLHSLFLQKESTTVFLSKLIYHLIHCLMYRPLLPIDLAQLSGDGQHQSWQIKAIDLCFIHANAIGELVDAARQAGTVGWPAMMRYCICTSATVHVHGAYYTTPIAYAGDVNVFAPSARFLAQAMQALKEEHGTWATAQHQSDMVQRIYTAHGELVQAMVSGSMRHTPGFHLEDFFDRYLNIGGSGGRSYRFDPAYLCMTDVGDESTCVRYAHSPSAGEKAAGAGFGNSPFGRESGIVARYTGSPMCARNDDLATRCTDSPSIRTEATTARYTDSPSVRDDNITTRYTGSPRAGDDFARQSIATSRCGHKRKSTASSDHEIRPGVEGLHGAEQQAGVSVGQALAHVQGAANSLWPSNSMDRMNQNQQTQTHWHQQQHRNQHQQEQQHQHRHRHSHPSQHQNQHQNQQQNQHPHPHPHPHPHQHQHQQQQPYPHQHQHQHQYQYQYQHRNQQPSEAPSQHTQPSPIGLPGLHHGFDTSIAVDAPPTSLQSYSPAMSSGNMDPNRVVVLPMGEIVPATATGSGASTTPMDYVPSFAYTPTNTTMMNNMSEAHHDAMFGCPPRHTYSSLGEWPDEAPQYKADLSRRGMYPDAQSMGGNGSGGRSAALATGQSDDTDPFLSLLEQLAEDHAPCFDGGKGVVGVDFGLGRE
ncbi:hypothetical protein E4U40_007295 [Claviceps sp. LM458 group G5]|nr:hypothetical protein E4U40_007295 [Claviceps sp. LM458 group G5]